MDQRNDFKNNVDNNNLLKVENLTKNQYDVIASVIDVPNDYINSKDNNSNVNFFNVLISAITFNIKDKENVYAKVSPIVTIKAVVLFVFVACLFYFSYQYLDKSLFIPLLMGVSSLIFPILLITLNYEFCAKKELNTFHILLSCFMGVLLYVIVNFLLNFVIIKYMYEASSGFFITPVLWGLGELVIIGILAKIFEIKDLPNGIFLAVCVGMGYAFMNCLHKEFTLLLETLTSANGTISTTPIADSLSYYQFLTDLLSCIGIQGVFYPVLYCCWSIVIGNVIIATELFSQKKESPLSIYLLLVFTILLNILMVYPTSLNYFETIIKIICALVSITISIKLVNKSLKISFENSD